MSAQNPTFKRYFKYVRNLSLGLASSISAFAFCRSMTENSYGVIYANDLATGAALSYVVTLVLITFAIEIFAFCMICLYFDNVDLFNKKDYFESDNRRFLLLHPHHLIPFLISLPFAPFCFAQNINTLIGLIFKVNPGSLGRITSFIIFVGIRLLQIYSLQKHWNNEIKDPDSAPKPMFKRNMDMNDFKIRQIILQPLGYILILVCVASFSDTIYSLLFSIVHIVISLVAHPLYGLWILAALLVIFAIPISLSLLNNIIKRLKLLRKLRKMQRDNIADVTYEGHKFFSVFFPSLIFNIYVIQKNGGDKFNCCIVSGGKMGAPMFFRSDRFYVEHGFRLAAGALMSRGGTVAVAVDTNVLGGMENPTNLIFGYKKGYDLNFANAAGKKILIINPSPAKVFHMHGNLCFPVDNGIHVFDYSIYTATAFENMIRYEYRM